MLDGDTELIPMDSASSSLGQPKFRHVITEVSYVRVKYGQTEIYKKVFFVLFGRITIG